jgi:hypothetical protein
LVACTTAPARADIERYAVIIDGATPCVGVLLPIVARYFVTTEVAAQTHFFGVEDQARTRELTARFAVRGVLGFGGWL